MKERIVILGIAESGVGAALLAKQQGYDVFASDSGKISEEFRNELIENQIDFEESGHTLEKLISAATVIKSPGIPESAEVVKRIRERNIELISEIEFAFRFKGHSKVIGITGSNGKTTTTMMIFLMLQKQGLDVALVGNIGFSFARQIATAPAEFYVAEISSFQLDDVTSFRPDIAVLTNITEDHMDRYDHKMENYIEAKFNIIKYQGEQDIFIYNLDDKITMDNLNKYLHNPKALPISMKKILPQGAYIEGRQMYIRFKDEQMAMSVEDFALKGQHNLYNSMAAGLAARAVDVKKENIRSSLVTMESLEHRMQFVATVRGIDFINDSKGTNVNSTWYALEGMEKPVVLILGGVDKGNDYRILDELIKEKVHAIVCMGVSNERIHAAFGSIVPVIVDASSAPDAVNKSYQLANSGDVVLLSPACASFDLFKNYEDRGEQFIKAVKNL